MGNLIMIQTYEDLLQAGATFCPVDSYKFNDKDINHFINTKDDAVYVFEDFETLIMKFPANTNTAETPDGKIFKRITYPVGSNWCFETSIKPAEKKAVLEYLETLNVA